MCIKKRFISLLLTVVLLITYITSTMVVSANPVSIDEHAYSVVQGYLGCFDDGLGATKISQRYIVENSYIERYLYVISNNSNKCIALLHITITDGKYGSTLEVGEDTNITAALQNNTPVSFGIVDTALVMYTSFETYHVYSDEVLLAVSDVSKAVIQLRPIPSTLTTCYVTEEYTTCGNLPLINNDYNDSMSAGICWAACLASMFNFRIATQLTAKDVYNYLKTYYPSTEPQSGQLSYSRFFARYGIPCNFFSSPLGYETVKSCLNGDKPVICQIYNVYNGSVAHAVLLQAARRSNSIPSGFNTSSSYIYYYTVMDPGVEPPATSAHYAVMIVDPADEMIISYTSDAFTFTRWQVSTY